MSDEELETASDWVTRQAAVMAARTVLIYVKNMYAGIMVEKAFSKGDTIRLLFCATPEPDPTRLTEEEQQHLLRQVFDRANIPRQVSSENFDRQKLADFIKSAMLFLAEEARAL